MRYLFKNKSLALFVIAAFLVGNFLLIGNTSAVEAPTFNGDAAGIISSNNLGVVSGQLSGDYSITISGQLTSYTENRATFIGKVTGDITGDITAAINRNGVDTMSGTITGTGAIDPVRVIGTFPKTGTNGDFKGEIITGPTPVLVTDITISGEGGATTVENGKTLQMIAGILPNEAANKNVAWSVWTNEADVNHGDATIDENTGLLTGTKVGPITVIAKALDGSLEDTTLSLNVILDTIAPKVTSVDSNTPGTIIYNFDEPVQLRDSANVEITSTNYADNLGIYNLDDYASHVVGTPAPEKQGNITNAVLSDNNKKLTITYTGSLVKKINTDYIVDAWGYNITDSAGNKIIADATSQKFTITGDNTPPTATATTPINDSSKTITYTFSEPVQLVSQADGSKPAASLYKNLLHIYSIDAIGNYGPSPVAGINITNATLSNNVLTITYTGSLIKNIDTTYVVDAWGYDITDLVGNVIAKNDPKQIFIVTGDTEKPTVESVVSNMAGLITYTFNEPVKLTTNEGADTDFTDKLAIYEANPTTGDYGLNTIANYATITSATLSDKVLTINYTGSLIKNEDVSYVVDAWGYKIVDLVGNRMEPALNQIFKIKGDNIAPTAIVHHSGNTITYTFDEAVELRDNDGAPVELTTDKIGIYVVTNGNYGLDTKIDNIIKSASLDPATKTLLTITYEGSLINQATTNYVVDAWGYRITDALNNKMLPSASQIFTVIGDDIKPTANITAHNETAKTITYSFDEPVHLVNQSTLQATDLSAQLLAIYPIDADGNYLAKADGVDVVEASLNSSNILTIRYTGSLIKNVDTTYVVDAWGYDITDLVGNVIAKNQAGQVFTVTGDVEAPIITLNSLPEITAEIHTYVEAGAVVTDNIDQSLTAIISGELNKDAVGSYTITYSATDSVGNVAIPVTRKVNVIDSIESAFNTISSGLSATGITNNLNDVTTDNIRSFSNLYFEKSINGAKMGKIEFNSALDLSLDSTKTFLESLGSKLEMSAGHIALDARTATNLKEAGASIEMYNLPQGLNMDQISMVVRDEDGNLLSNVTSNIEYTDLGVCEVGGVCTILSFNASHFTSFDADIDNTAPVISLTGEASISLLTGETYADNGATALDNKDGDITAKITTTNPVDTSKVGTYTITYNVSDAAKNKASQVTRTVIVKMDPEDDESNLLIEEDEDGIPSGIVPTNTNLSVSSAQISASINIPAGTIVTGPIGWNGEIKSPQIIETTVNPTAESGKNFSNVNSIEIGFGDTHLTFNNPVKITFTGKAENSVGWSQNGVFHNITNVCDSITNPTLEADSECKINSGSDLVVWTKHFTTFTTYVQTKKTTSGGGGGVSSVAPCSAITYGEWKAAVNGVEYRDIIKQAPNNCALTATQQSGRSRAVFLNNRTNEPETPSNNNDKQVLGEKKYANGTLLRGNGPRVYVVIDEKLLYLPTLKELAKYRGPIIKVNDSVLVNFPKMTVLGVKKYADGTLLRAKNTTKIYVIKDGKKVHIRTLVELRKYKGKVLVIEASELANY